MLSGFLDGLAVKVKEKVEGKKVRHYVWTATPEQLVVVDQFLRDNGVLKKPADPSNPKPGEFAPVELVRLMVFNALKQLGLDLSKAADTALYIVDRG